MHASPVGAKRELPFPSISRDPALIVPSVPTERWVREEPEAGSTIRLRR